jgi:hypothetical protein
VGFLYQELLDESIHCSGSGGGPAFRTNGAADFSGTRLHLFIRK